MKKVRTSILFLLANLFIFSLQAQNQSVSIGTATIDPDAVLFLLGDGTQGLILPKTTDITAMPKKAGMVVYNESDGKVYSCDGNAWTALNGGSSSNPPVLQINGNDLSIFLGSNVGLATTAPTNKGQLLMWDGAKWTSTTATDPTLNDILVWNGARWAPSTNYISTISGTAPVNVVTTGKSSQVSISNITNNEISNTAAIADSKLATITTAGKVSGDAITSGTISGSTAINTTGTITAGNATVTGLTIGTQTWPAVSSNGVLTNTAGVLSWAPAAGVGTITSIAAGTGLLATPTSPIVSSGTLSVNVGTGANQIPQLDNTGKLNASVLPATVDANASDDITTATTAGGHLTGTYPNPTIATTAATGNTIVTAINAGSGSIADARLATITTAGKVSGNAINTGTISGNTIINTTGTINSGAITATSFAGDGSALTNINATVADGSITGGTAGVGVKIAANTITSANLATGAVTNAQLASGIDASKITTGTLPVAQVPSLDATKITTGTFAAARIPGLDASTIVSGTLPVSVGGTGRTTWNGLLIGAGSVINDISNGTNGQVLTIAAGSPTWQTPTTSGAAGGSLSGTYPNPSIAGGAITASELAANAVTGVAVASGAISDAKISDVSPSKILQSAATSGQVLKWNGSAWAPAADNVGGGGAPTLNPGQIIVGDGTSNSAATVSLDATLNSTNGNITVQGLRGRPISATVPATNSVYQYDGTQWAPVVLAGGGTVTNIATGTGLTGGPISSTGTISILAGGVTTTELAATSVTNAKIAANAVNSSQIIDGTIANADISGTAAIAVNKLATGTNGQVLTVSAGVPTWVTSAAMTNPMTTLGDIIHGGAAGAPTRLAGAAGFLKSTGAAAPTWSAVNLASADVTGTLPGSQVNPAFGSQSISTTGAITSGAITSSGNISATGTVTATAGMAAGSSSQFTISNTGNITKINNVVTSFPAAQGAANSVLTNDGVGGLTWAAVPSPFSTVNLVPRGNGTGLVASNIFDNGTNVSIGTQTPSATSIASYKFLVYGANEAIGVDNTSITIGDVVGNSNGNYFLTDFENVPRFAFMGAPVGVGTISPTYPVDIKTALGASDYGLNHTDGNIVMSTYVGSGGPTGGSIGTQSNHPFFIYTANSGAKLTVLPNGNVGIGPFAPTSKLEVSGNIVNSAPSVGYLALTGDLPGYAVDTYPTLKTNSTYMYFSAGNTYTGYIGTTPDAVLGLNNSGGTANVYLNTNGDSYFSGGNLGIGTTTPAGKLHIEGAEWSLSPLHLSSAGTSAGAAIRFANAAVGNHTYDIIGSTGTGASPGAGSFGIWDATSSAYRFVIKPTGFIGINTFSPDANLSVSGTATKTGGGSWATFSDSRLKKDITDFKDGLSVLESINPVRFKYNGLGGYENDGKEYVGVVAQDVQRFAPYMISKVSKKMRESDAKETDLLMYDGSALTYILVNAVKEQQKQIKKLQSHADEKDKRITELEELLKTILENKRDIENLKTEVTNLKSGSPQAKAKRVRE